MNLYSDYNLKDLKEKIHFWDVVFTQEAKKAKNLSEEDMLQFFKKVILDSAESLFCRMCALKELITWTFLDKIKKRKTISFLLDEMNNSNEDLLECYRIKYLALFYQKEKQEIRELLIQKCNEQNDIIKAEARYQLGLIMFFDSNDIYDKKDFLKSIITTQNIFEEVSGFEENRIDAKLLSLICSYITKCFNSDFESSEETYQKIKELIFKGMLFQIDEELSPIYLNIGWNISRVQEVISNNPDTWICYKEEFNKLCLDFYAISNSNYKNNEFYNLLSYRMNERIKKEVIEPIFKYNYKATLSKIEVLLSEHDIDENMKLFLEYLKDILLSENIKELDYSREWVKQNFPMLTEDDLDSFDLCLCQSNVSEAIYNLVSKIQRPNPTKLLNDIISSCISLQANMMYKDRKEDERNDYIRDMLSAQKYQLRDQTRQGTSQKGKASGEIDILILDGNRPFSLIEALNLDSLNTSNLNAHIDKIFKYDPLGYKCNFLVSYVKVKDFSAFWGKYVEHIRKYNYPYPMDSFEENIGDKYFYPNLKLASTTLIHNEIKTTIYHICVLIQQ